MTTFGVDNNGTLLLLSAILIQGVIFVVVVVGAVVYGKWKRNQIRTNTSGSKRPDVKNDPKAKP